MGRRYGDKRTIRRMFQKNIVQQHRSNRNSRWQDNHTGSMVKEKVSDRQRKKALWVEECGRFGAEGSRKKRGLWQVLG